MIRNLLDELSGRLASRSLRSVQRRAGPSRPVAPVPRRGQRGRVKPGRRRKGRLGPDAKHPPCPRGPRGLVLLVAVSSHASDATELQVPVHHAPHPPDHVASGRRGGFEERVPAACTDQGRKTGWTRSTKALIDQCPPILRQFGTQTPLSSVKFNSGWS
jgi:hypothetical protein